MVTRYDTERLVSFMELLHKFQQIERVVHAPDLVRFENDTEHSYSLAMASWYLVELLHLDLDVSKVLKYALVHDMVEVYAGDTYVFDTKAKSNKHERESKAREQLLAEFPDFPSMHLVGLNYESRADNESIFVHAVDKLLPAITNYLQNGHTWKNLGVSFSQVFTLKRETTQHSPEVAALLEHLIDMYNVDKAHYFGKLTD